MSWYRLELIAATAIDCCTQETYQSLTIRSSIDFARRKGLVEEMRIDVVTLVPSQSEHRSRTPKLT